MAQLAKLNVTWIVCAVDSGGAERIVGQFAGCEDEAKNLEFAQKNRKRWSVSKKTKLKIYRRPNTK